ncbi:DUF1800 family protein [Brevundimonas sp. R86498]|uniref:DUF1800 family protein n=1 Tax=Brevundimonas sp. R86498 TaxID=3093845 RepID=UPI0037CB2959
MPPHNDAQLDAAIALTRFGLGARAGEIETVALDPRGWLNAQIRADGAPLPAGPLANSPARLQAWRDYQNEGQRARERARAAVNAAIPVVTTVADADAAQARAAFDARRESRRALAQGTAGEFLARATLGATTDAGFSERWALFWANVFTVSASRFPSSIVVGSYEREAIRPHVFARFEDLVIAADTHPAMLIYLDQARSVGPNSRAGTRRRAGLNENLAREILELHTLGSDGGYSQNDVTELARALTGWTIPSARDGNGPMRADDVGAGGHGAVFRPLVHEPGERTILGRAHADTGAEQGLSVLRDLANRPETARRLSRKIATHFVADDPPPALVERLATTWIRSGGNLARVARTLVMSPEAWHPHPAKMKTPYEFVISTHRALGTRPRQVKPLQQALDRMGHPAFSPPSPEGWPDMAADWTGPDALVKRLNWATEVSGAARVDEPNVVAAAALGARLSERTRLAVARAESRTEALTLFLMSPEFQRR